MKIWASLLTLAAGVAVGVWWLMTPERPESLPPPQLQQPTKILEHPNGLRLEVPSELKVAQRPSGFWLGSGLVRTRGGWDGEVEVTDGELNTKGSEQREVAPGIVYYYSVRMLEKDMAYYIFSLNACRQMGTRFVCLHQLGESKGGTPYFGIWSLAPGISLK